MLFLLCLFYAASCCIACAFNGGSWSRSVSRFSREGNGVASPPSVYYAYFTYAVLSCLLPLFFTSATRFRWIQRFDTRPGHASDGGKSRQQWALDDVYIGLGCPSLCNGHGRCMYPSCFCDPGYGGATCYQTEQIRSSLFETFDDEPAAEVNWDLVQGGSVGFGCKTIVDGQGLYFTGKGQRQVVTVDLDLRLASYIKYHAMIGGPSTKIGCGAPRSRDEDIILQFSHDGGITWQLLHILDYDSYWKTPQWDYISLPPEARTNTTRVRWWQKIGADDPDRPIGWVIDDVIIAGMDINPSELFESFESGLNKAFWEFHPNGYLQEGVCGRNGMVMVWGEKAALKMITTCQLIVQDGYMMQFKISVGCDQSDNACERNQAVALEYNKDPTSDEWDLVYPQCLLSGQNTECRPYGFHQGTLYSAASHGTWTRVTIALPPKTFSSQTRFRWVQRVAPSSRGDSPSWALDDVLIAERCPDMCRGRGDCIDGTCYCDPGYVGPTCEPQRHLLLSYLTDGFEGGVQPLNWASVEGGGMGLGCGVLLPAAHGKNLYFNGCGIRQATTAEMDLTKASKLTFVLQIGSHKQTPTCNIRLDNDACNGKITLQYTRNKGIDWTLLAVHNPTDFLSPKKIAYDIPSDARAVGVQFRWWQPEHRGSGSDQWAIDHVEIKITHLDQMMRDNFFSSRFNSKEEMMKRKQLSSFSSSSIRIV